MILILIIIALLVIAVLFSTSSRNSSYKSTQGSESSQKNTKKKPSTPRIFAPTAPSNTRRPPTPTPSVKEPLSSDIPGSNSAGSTNLREKLKEYTGNTSDIPTNTTKPINNFIEASRIWSEGLVRAAKKHDEEMRIKEQAASAKRRKDALQRWLKAEKALAESDVEIVDGQFRLKSSATTKRQNTNHPIRSEEPSKKEEPPSEDKGLTMRETLHKIMGAAGNTMDVVSNSTTMANNLVDAGVDWSEGIARGAKRRKIDDVRLAEDAASLERRFEAAKRWRKARVGMAKNREPDVQHPEQATNNDSVDRKSWRTSTNTTEKRDNDFYITVRRERASSINLLIVPELGWLDFPRLAVSRGLTHAYAIGYRFKDMKHDMWTSRFNNFKYGEPDAIKGASAMLQYAVLHLVKMRFSSINPDKILFMPALSSREEKADPERPMCQITQRCATICNASYNDTVLSKKAHRPIHKFSAAQERHSELDKAQYKSKFIKEEHIFIFDDIITRGDTLSHVACAILEKNPHCKVYGIALAKAESLSYHPYLNNNIIPEAWNREWKNNSYIPS